MAGIPGFKTVAQSALNLKAPGHLSRVELYPNPHLLYSKTDSDCNGNMDIFCENFGGGNMGKCKRASSTSLTLLVVLLGAAGWGWGQTTAGRRVAEEMAGLETALPAATWKVEAQPWTAAMFRQAAELLGERERAEKILERWQDGHSLTWTHRSDPGRQTAVGVLRFKDADGARSYYGFAADLQRKQDERLRGGCGSDRCVLDSHSRAVTIAGADEAFCVERRWQPAPKAPAMKVCQLWVRAGGRVLEFSWVGGDGDVPWAERAVQHLTKRIAAR